MERERGAGDARADAVVGASLALLAGLVLLDLTTGVQLAGVYGSAAVVASTTADPRRTLGVGALAVLTAAVAGLWHHHTFSTEWAFRVAGCLVIVVAAVAAASTGRRMRERLRSTTTMTQRLLDALAPDLAAARTVREVAESFVRNAVSGLGVASARVYVLDADRVLRSLAWSGAGAGLPQQYDEVPLSADLPGALAVREDTTLHYRDLAEILAAFPDLAGYDTEQRSLHLLPLHADGVVSGLLVLSFPGGTVPYGATSGLLESLADVLGRALQRAERQQRDEAAAQRSQLLAEASVTLSRSLDYQATLEEVCRLLVPRFADWCAVHWLEDGSLSTAALEHVDPGTTAWAREVLTAFPTRMDSEAGAPLVVRTGTSVVYPFISEELIERAAVSEEHAELLKRLGMRSGVVAPLRGRSGVLGAVTLVHAESGRQYTEADARFLEDVAARAGVALETAVTFRDQSSRLATMTRVAEAAQRAILAPPPAVLGGVALRARYVSAAAEARIGGDLYEVVPYDDGVRLLVGDVRGKGLVAVRTATVVLGEFRSSAADTPHLADVARQLDRRLRPYLDEEDFVTACLVELRRDGSYSLVSCGHPPPVVASGGVLRELAPEPTLPLGLGSDPVASTGRLERGDRLALFTDGLTEARRGGDGPFLDLHESLAPILRGTLDEALDQVLAGLEHAAGGRLGDDLALLLAEPQR